MNIIQSAATGATPADSRIVPLARAGAILALTALLCACASGSSWRSSSAVGPDARAKVSRSAAGGATASAVPDKSATTSGSTAPDASRNLESDQAAASSGATAAGSDAAAGANATGADGQDRAAGNDSDATTGAAADASDGKAGSDAAGAATDSTGAAGASADAGAANEAGAGGSATGADTGTGNGTTNGNAGATAGNASAGDSGTSGASSAGAGDASRDATAAGGTGNGSASGADVGAASSAEQAVGTDLGSGGTTGAGASALPSTADNIGDASAAAGQGGGQGGAPVIAGVVQAPGEKASSHEVVMPQTLGGMLPLTIGVDGEGEFDFDRAVLRDETKVLLDQLATKLKDAEYDQLEIVGHADRIGTEEYNQYLSERRAWAVARYLVKQGVPVTKLKVIGKGMYQPVTQPDECVGLDRSQLIACVQKDRRVEISASIRRTDVDVR